MKKIIILILLLTASLMADVKAGEKIFKSTCSICHTVDGSKSRMGPDFNIVSYTRPKKAIAEYVRDPYRMYEAFGYSANAMPTLPLTDQEILDVADYIDSIQPFKKWMKKS